MKTIASACFLVALSTAQGATPIPIAMTPDHWQTKENAEFLKQPGFYRGMMRLNSGSAMLKDVTFRDGTIEFDVNTIGRGMPGIAFRQRDEGTFELLYLRPDPACPSFHACLQYTPQTHGVMLWDLYPQYQNRAYLRENGWNHIRMVISGRRMNVFVNDAAAPTLEVGSLEGDAAVGALRFLGPATFANLEITPGATEGLAAEPARDPLEGDRGLMRNWRMSGVSVLAENKIPVYGEMPGESQNWKAIAAERMGLINLTRTYGLPVHAPDRGLVWLKTTITSDRKQTKKLDIGWTREVWVFVNGKRVFADRNSFDLEEYRRFPDGRCSLENGNFTVDLEAGDNEVAVALANNYFGWGLVMRAADPEGVRPAQ